MRARVRRKYCGDKRCQDCGRDRATRITFWVNGMLYWVCPEHAREYRLMRVILKPYIHADGGTA